MLFLLPPFLPSSDARSRSPPNPCSELNRCVRVRDVNASVRCDVESRLWGCVRVTQVNKAGCGGEGQVVKHKWKEGARKR